MLVALLTAALAAAAPAAQPACDLERPSGAPGCTRAAVDALPMSAIQTVGTHNSYKQAIAPAELAVLRAASPATADSLDYAHPPLAEQLDAGARQLELDLFNDPEGGRYADPIGARGTGPGGHDLAPLRAPGLKVMHVQDIDYRSRCPLFAECLRQIRAWSAAHPEHVPLAILINLKEAPLPFPGASVPALFDGAAMDAIDAEIAAVFGPHALITPARVRGDAPTLREAVTTRGWPTLRNARGRVFFALDAPLAQVDRYRSGGKPRLMFLNVAETDPDAAYLTLNEPTTQSARIEAAVRAGFIVRTRADADTVEARRNDTDRQGAAFDSGAQYISTDYMRPDPRLSPYTTMLPGGGVARRSPALH